MIGGEPVQAEMSPENETFLRELIESETYADRTEALNEAVRLLRRKVEIEKQLLIGIDSGTPEEVNPEYWQQKRASLLGRISGGSAG